MKKIKEWIRLGRAIAQLVLNISKLTVDTTEDRRPEQIVRLFLSALPFFPPFSNKKSLLRMERKNTFFIYVFFVLFFSLFLYT